MRHLPRSQRITVTHTQCGQPRPYADSVYSGTVFVEELDGEEWKPVPWEASYSKHLAKHIHDWSKEGRPSMSQSAGEYFQNHLAEFERIGPGLFKATIISPFAD